jgi:hypothetical protein
MLTPAGSPLSRIVRRLVSCCWSSAVIDGAAGFLPIVAAWRSRASARYCAIGTRCPCSLTTVAPPAEVGGAVGIAGAGATVSIAEGSPVTTCSAGAAVGTGVAAGAGGAVGTGAAAGAGGAVGAGAGAGGAGGVSADAGTGGLGGIVDVSDVPVANGGYFAPGVTAAAGGGGWGVTSFIMSRTVSAKRAYVKILSTRASARVVTCLRGLERVTTTALTALYHKGSATGCLVTSRTHYAILRQTARVAYNTGAKVSSR